MPNDETAPGDEAAGGANAGGSVGGGGGGKSALGGAGETQGPPPRALFVGFLFPSPLDEQGNLSSQPLNRGLGEPHLVTVIYAYNTVTEGASLDLHAGVDKLLGRPFFKAYIYPVTESNLPHIASVGGGGGGKSALGGAPGEPIYLGQFHATVPADDDSEDNNSAPGAGNPANG